MDQSKNHRAVFFTVALSSDTWLCPAGIAALVFRIISIRWQTESRAVKNAERSADGSPMLLPICKKQACTDKSSKQKRQRNAKGARQIGGRPLTLDVDPVPLPCVERCHATGIRISGQPVFLHTRFLYSRLVCALPCRHCPLTPAKTKVRAQARSALCSLHNDGDAVRDGGDRPLTAEYLLCLLHCLLK